MLGELAIIALAIFNQFNLIAADQNREVFLGQFVSFTQAQNTGAVKGVKWDLRKEGLGHQAQLEVLPLKVKSDVLDVSAVSALAMDVGTDFKLYEKNPAKRMPIASLSKIMTALVVLENRNLEETVTISPRAMAAFGDKRGLVAGEKIRLEDLLRLMVIDSNNAAAVALAEHTGGSVENFVALMNAKAAVLGLKDTKFVNPTGLDVSGEDNYSTAYDLAQLTDYALPQGIFWEMSRTPSATVYSIDRKQKHTIKNTDELLGQMDNVYGGKTGYTVDAGECLLLVSQSADKKHKVISVVLNAEDRFAETKRLTDWVFNVYSW